MPTLIFCQSDYLIQVVDTNSNTEWQTVQIQRSQLFWIYTLCKGRAYPGSEGQGFRIIEYCTVYGLTEKTF